MEATARVYLFLTIPLLFFSFLKVSKGQGENECGYPNPPLQGTFSTLPQVPSGVQAILPSYKFRCDGLINQIVVQVMGESTRLDVQIWRPIDEDVNNGIYSLYWSSSVLNDDSAAASSPDSVLPQRVDNIVSFAIPSGVQVKRDDVMGYYIERNSNPVRMGYFNTTTMESDITSSVVYALEDVDGPLCNISLTCNSNVKSIPHAAPIIYAELADDTPDANSQNSLLTSPLVCIKKAVDTSCSDLLNFMHDNPPVGSTAMPSITATKTVSDSMMQRTASTIVNPTPLPYTEDSRSGASAGPPSQITDPAGSNQGQEASNTDNPPPEAGLTVTFNPLVIGFIVIGAFLFVTLIILVFVLIFCLRRKSRPKAAKARPRRLTDVESVDSRVTASTHLATSAHLAASSSVEHSNSSVATTTPAVSTVLPGHERRAIANGHGAAANGNGHIYANTDISQEGDFSPFSPLYENRKRFNHGSGHIRAKSVGHGVDNEISPTRRFAVRDRGWSTGALHKVNAVVSSESSQALVEPGSPHSRGPPRTRSCSSSKLNQLINEPTIPAPIPPPRSRSNSASVTPAPQILTRSPKRIMNRYSAIETTTSDYSSEDLSKRPKSHSVHALNSIAIDRKAWKTVEEDEDESHDYADPDYPSGDEDHDCLLEPKYDKLVTNHKSPYEDIDIYPEDFVDDTSPPPLPPKSTGTAIYQDPEINSSREDVSDLPSMYYGYVPTAEQRRLLLLQNGGHYEISDGVSSNSIDGYDHLSYFQEVDTYWAPAETTIDLYEQLSANKYRELLRSQIKIMKRIGSGHFGTVSKGLWCCGEDAKEVAVKTVKTTTEQERVKLLQEAAIMGQFAHNNVIRLHGVVTVGEPVLIVLEYMTRGDLRSFLQKLHPRTSKRDLPDVLPKLFIKFSKDIAGGMSYLSKKNFIHRDLAARNILLTQDLTCKIGDFGMARDIEGESDYYRSHGGIIPVKWTAPEALNYNKYSSASDVWSYGMVLFEIWSLGEKPFNDLTNPIVIALVSSKHCQPPPPGCPRPIYHLMVECWNPDHNRRPNFDSIHDYLDSPEESLLQWQPADVIPGKQAHVLGAILSEANDLYLDLQRTYQKPPPFASKI